jgi:hypothetical protein
MKVTFEFDTDSENFDSIELEAHYQARDLVSCLSNILDKTRSWYKYDEREEIPTEEIRDEIVEIINDHVNTEKLGL